MDRKKEEILRESITKLNRGEIDKKQYLKQQKSILTEKLSEKQHEKDKLQAIIDSTTRQIAEIETELEAIEQVEQE